MLSKAKELSKRAMDGQFDDLSDDEQQLIKDYDCGLLQKALRQLVAQRAPVYRGVGACVESNAPDFSSLAASSAARPAPKAGGPAASKVHGNDNQAAIAHMQKQLPDDALCEIRNALNISQNALMERVKYGRVRNSYNSCKYVKYFECVIVDVRGLLHDGKDEAVCWHGGVIHHKNGETSYHGTRNVLEIIRSGGVLTAAQRFCSGMEGFYHSRNILKAAEYAWPCNIGRDELRSICKLRAYCANTCKGKWLYTKAGCRRYTIEAFLLVRPESLKHVCVT